MLRQRTLRWLGHVRRMKDGRTPKIFCTESSLLKNAAILGIPNYAIVMCASDVKEMNIDLNKWEEFATNRSKWKSYLQATLKVGEKKSRLKKKIKLPTS